MKDGFKIYARIVILDKSKKKLLLLRKNNAQKIGAGAWMLPGGTVEWGENISEALIREVKEETNLTVSSLALRSERRMIIGNTHWLGLYYFGETTNEDELRNIESDKHEKMSFIPLELLPHFSDFPMFLFTSNLSNNKEYTYIPEVKSENHSMGLYLDEYVEIKMHHVFTEYLNDVKSIKIVPAYTRSALVSKKEKDGKLFNYKRPTIFYEDDNMYLACFPAKDYVFHYALLVKNYLDSKGKNIPISFFLPTSKDTKNCIINSIENRLPKADFVVYGNVDKLEITNEKKWNKIGDMSYQIIERNNKKMLFLGCEYSVWGNATETFLEVIKEQTDCKAFIYIGKVGTMIEGLVPNENIAVCSSSLVDGEIIELSDIFNLADNKIFITGKHYTLSSVLLETKDLILSIKNEYHFIDPEIGYFASSAKKLGISFSNLHIISDNVCDVHAENLSNERKDETQSKRKELWKQVGKTLLCLLE